MDDFNGYEIDENGGLLDANGDPLRLRITWKADDGEEIDITDYCSNISIGATETPSKRKYFDPSESHSFTIRWPSRREALQRRYIMWWLGNMISMN